MAKNHPPEPPYRWRPLGTKDIRQPAVGQVIAWRHMAWRVIESAMVPEIDWRSEDRETLEYYNLTARRKAVPWRIIVRPATITGDDPRDRDHDVHLSVRAGFGGFDAYPGTHYPICAQCHEPVPCREEMARKIGEKAEQDAARYEIPGVCPACSEPVTSRHKVMTFEDNLRVPFGPPVTFHVGRRECRHYAAKYEREMAEANPGHWLVLSCPGHVWRHADGPECSEGDDCRGLKVEHPHVNYCDSRCSRCRDFRESAEDRVKARNAAGDWTVW